MKPETAGNAPEPKLDDICGTCGQRYGLHARMSCPFPDGSYQFSKTQTFTSRVAASSQEAAPPKVTRVIPGWAQDVIANPKATADELRRAYASENVCAEPAPSPATKHPPSNSVMHKLSNSLPEELQPLYCTMSPVPLEEIRSRLITAFEEVANDQYAQAYEFITNSVTQKENRQLYEAYLLGCEDECIPEPKTIEEFSLICGDNSAPSPETLATWHGSSSPAREEMFARLNKRWGNRIANCQRALGEAYDAGARSSQGPAREETLVQLVSDYCNSKEMTPYEFANNAFDAGAKSVVAAPQNEISQWIDTELWNFAHALALDLGVSHDAAGDKSKEELIHRSMSAVIGICLRMAGAAALPSQEPK